MSRFVWTDELKARAERLYVEERKAPSTVARCLSRECPVEDIRAMAAAGDWDALRGSRAFFSADQVEAVRALYVDRLRTAEEVAGELGEPWTAKGVRALATRRGWSDARSRVRQAALVAREAAALARRPPRPEASQAKGQPEDLQAMIDAAVAAGKVTVLPTGRAAGLTNVEQAFWAAGAAAAFDWRGRR